MRILLGLGRGGMAHNELGQIKQSGPLPITSSKSSGILCMIVRRCGASRGDPWDIKQIDSGIFIAIPVGTNFQLRSFGYELLAAIGVTMPSWPGKGKAYFVEGK